MDKEIVKDWHNQLDRMLGVASKPCKCTTIKTINSTMHYTCVSCVAKMYFDKLKPIMDCLKKDLNEYEKVCISEKKTS